MAKINWVRLIAGGLVAAIMMFFTDGFFHERLLRADWQAIYAGIGATEPQPHGSSMVYFAIYELGRGMISMLLYATMRAYFRPGPQTAVLAGIAGWIAFSVTGPAQFIPLGFFSTSLWLKLAGLHLVTTVLATIVGAAMYKDATRTANV